MSKLIFSALDLSETYMNMIAVIIIVTVLVYTQLSEELYPNSLTGKINLKLRKCKSSSVREVIVCQAYVGRNAKCCGFCRKISIV